VGLGLSGSLKMKNNNTFGLSLHLLKKFIDIKMIPMLEERPTTAVQYQTGQPFFSNLYLKLKRIILMKPTLAQSILAAACAVALAACGGGGGGGRAGGGRRLADWR